MRLHLLFAFVATAFWAAGSAPLGASDRPNILWITVEDMSPVLGCYGDEFAKTPRLDALAREGLRYENAFAFAPVCSPSRSGLITGLHPVTQGTHEMRSAVPLPKGLRGFPAYLRDAGYFTTNNVKTDYNTADAPRLIEESWNESSPDAHWRDPERQPGQPFFAVFNDMTTHQSRTMVWSHDEFAREIQSRLEPEDVASLDDVPIPPYYPDSWKIRRTLARFYDCVTVMDRNVGDLLAQLEQDGLAENTIVFFFSDHGSGLPRHKRLLHDSGMRVPLLVRIPEKFRHLAPAPPGAVIRDLVSFADFPPTVLALAGLEIPGVMQGRVFLGRDPAPAPRYVYGTRDRVDEVLERSRSLRDERYLYLRNFLPFHSHHAPSAFSDLGAIRSELDLFAQPGELEKLTPAQRDYLGPAKPVEAFYDVQSDPNQIVNLLETKMTPEQKAALGRFRRDFAEARATRRDAGALPESHLWTWMRAEGAPIGDVLAGKTDHTPDLSAIWAAADLVGKGTLEAFESNLGDPEPAIRYWTIQGLRQLGGADARDLARPLLEDVDAAVRITVAAWLAAHEPDRALALDVLVTELENEDWWTALAACRAIELLGTTAKPALEPMRRLYERTRQGPGDENLFLAFSAGAWLDEMGEPTIPWDFGP